MLPCRNQRLLDVTGKIPDPQAEATHQTWMKLPEIFSQSAAVRLLTRPAGWLLRMLPLPSLWVGVDPLLLLADALVSTPDLGLGGLGWGGVGWPALSPGQRPDACCCRQRQIQHHRGSAGPGPHEGSEALIDGDLPAA